MHITEEALKSYKTETEQHYRTRRKNLSITKLCNTVSSIVFLVLSCILTYCSVLYFDRVYPLEEQTFANLDPINKFLDPIMNAVGFGTRPWFLLVPICLCGIILIPFAVTVILSILGKILFRGKGFKDLPNIEQKIPYLKELISYAETAGKPIPAPSESNSLLNWLYILFVGMIIVYSLVVTSLPASEIIYGIIVFLILGAILFWVYRLFILAWKGLCSLLRPREIKATADLIRKMKADIATEERLQKEEAEQQKRLFEQKQAAYRKKQAEEKQKAARELYIQATAGAEYDQGLLKKAALMGNPEAGLILGKELIHRWSSEDLTRSEKAQVIRDAGSYLNAAAPHSTEGKFLHIFARFQYEKKDKIRLKAMLSDVRNIRSSGKLPEEYRETCNLLIKTLVETIDNIPDKPTPVQKTYSTGSTASYTARPIDRPLATHEKLEYINKKCLGMWSPSAIATIENDPNLTASQKEDLKNALMIFGD